MRKTFITCLTITLLILSVCLPAFTNNFLGFVVGILDGDTFYLLGLEFNGEPSPLQADSGDVAAVNTRVKETVRVHLHGIAAPEKNA